jgi:hypothetical protein
VDRFGNKRWGGSGVAVCTASNTQALPRVVADGAGGAYIAWHDSRGSDQDIYAQRLDANGVPQWTSNGIVVCAESGIQSDCQMAPDSWGGAVLVWQDQRAGSIYGIYGQRLDSAGSALWGAGGVIVCNALGDQTLPQLAVMPATSVFNTRVMVAFQDGRDSGTSDLDIYAQKLNLNSGSRLWGNTGVVVCDQADRQEDVDVIVSGYGLIAVWEDQRGGDEWVYAQQLDINGTRQWTTNGVSIMSELAGIHSPRVAPDGEWGAVIVASVCCSIAAAAQRIDASGNVLWGNFIQLNPTEKFDEIYPRVVPDGTGGGIFGFAAYRDAEFDWDVYANRVRGDLAQKVWGGPGLEAETVCAAQPSFQSEVEITDITDGGVFFVWKDMRDANGGIYAQRIDAVQGKWGHPDPILWTVADVPDDEGGWVRIHVHASGYDDAATTDFPVSGYTVWRRTDPAASPALAAAAGSRDDILARLADPERAAGARVTSAMAAALDFPPGDWEAVAYVGAVQDTGYVALAPTRTDSTGAGAADETFVVTAHTTTPSVYFVSATGNGHSVDNLAPGPLTGLAGEASYAPAGLQITWDPSDALDLAYYAVYRATFPGFVVGPGTLVGTTPVAELFDPGWTSTDGYYYKVAAVDRHGNAGPYALLEPELVTGTGSGDAPMASYLRQNHPNPFRATTVIRFGLESPADVHLRIYDVAGRLVRVLDSGGVMPAGHHEVSWEGRNDGGRAVATGIYFCRLQAGDFTQTRRMVIVR